MSLSYLISREGMWWITTQFFVTQYLEGAALGQEWAISVHA